MSKLDELHKRKATHVYNTRIDVRYLATLIRFWHKNNELPRSISELNRLSIETFVEFLVKNNYIDMVEMMSDAEEILSNVGYKVKTIPRNRVDELLREDSTLDLNPLTIDSSHQRTRQEKPVSDFDISEATKQFEQNLGDEMAKRIQEEQERSKAFKDHMGIPHGSEDTENTSD